AIHGAGRVVAVLARPGQQTLDVFARRDAAADAGALEVQRRRADVPAAVLLADAVPGRHADVVEEDLVEAQAAAHVDQRLYGDAGRAEVEQEEADAAVLRRLRLGPGQHEHPVRLVRV